jgi:PhnB protein
MSKVKPIPEGYHTATPYMHVRDAARAIEFYKKAFGAVERFRHADPQGKVGHAEIRIGNSIIMLADEFAPKDALGPLSRGGCTMTLMLYVENVDTLFQQAVSAGATVIQPLADQFYGDRSGGVKDPFGQVWYLATHVEDVSPEELQRRAAAAGR